MTSSEPISVELAKHPQGDTLARLVHALACSCFDEQRRTLSEGLSEAQARLSIDAQQAETSHGNVVRALEHGPLATGPERKLLATLLIRGVMLAKPEGMLAEERAAELLVWVGANTPLDPLSELGSLPTSGDDAACVGGIWRGVVRIVARYDEGLAIARASALYAAIALARTSHSDARREAHVLAPTLRDPLIKGLWASGPVTQQALRFQAEVVAPPRRLIVQLLMTPVLPITAFCRLFARIVLQLRRPAEVNVAPDGVTVHSRTEIFGKTLREWDWVVPAGGLRRAARQVRYPRLATYVGIAALLLGSYVGFRLVFDGLRVGAPDFLGLGIAVVIIALFVDYITGRIPTRAPKECELLLVTEGGVAIGLAGVDRLQADMALSRLKGSSGISS